MINAEKTTAEQPARDATGVTALTIKLTLTPSKDVADPRTVRIGGLLPTFRKS